MSDIYCDAFEMGIYRDCGQKYDYRIQQNLVTKGYSPGRGFGSVLHKGREIWRRGLLAGQTHDLAVVAGLIGLEKEYLAIFGNGVQVDEKRSLGNAKTLFTGYCAKFAFQNYKPIHIEIPFKLFVGVTPQGHRVWRTGILDEYCEFGGRRYVLDLKTSTPYPGGSWFDGWRTSDQLMGYLWATRQLYGDTHGVIIHGIWVHTPAKTSRAKYKFEDYFTADIITFTDGQLEEWKRKFLLSIDRREADKTSGDFQSNWGSACKAYGRTCDYFKLCSADPAIRPSIQQIYFDKVAWTPMADERLSEVAGEEAA